MRLNKASLFLLTQAAGPVLGLPKNKLDDQVQAEIDAGTFQNPSANVRPRFRYWIPDAAAELQSVADDVKEIGRIGAGGFELLGFFLYGGAEHGWGDTPGVDWSVYGWGTKAWQTLFKAFAQAHKDNGLIMDFAMGPNQGQGVPAEYNDDGKAWDLVSQDTRFAANDTKFEGTLKGWGTGPLEACVLAGTRKGGNNKVLITRTMVDCTKQVSQDGKLSVTFPEPETYNYILFAIYLIHSHYVTQNSPLNLKGPQTPPPSWVQNGSWAVDHFSRRGAQTAIKFWEEHVLTDGVLDLVKEVGNYAWEDSIEIRQKVRWSKDFRQRFLRDNNYDVGKSIPVIGFGFNTDAWDEGERYRMDHRTTIANAYGEFLEEWNTWVNERLGIQYSVQVAYGAWMDMQQNVPKVNAPETESLIYDNVIDKYRQYCGPANLAGKRVISIELGAEIYRAFQQPLPELFNTFLRAVAGGVNQAVIHGSSYTGFYPNTTWPGMVTFGYQFSDSHNRHQPAWEDYPQFMDAFARLQFIMQQGIPRRDLVFYEKRFWFPGNASYTKNDLQILGYSYDHISPENFHLPTATVKDGIFAPERQQFKALVVRILDRLTVPAVRGIAKLAQAGLPMVFEGGIPTRAWAPFHCAADQIYGMMHEIAKLPNVHVVSEADGIANTLTKLGIEPLTKVNTTGSWYTVWREDTKNNVDYVFVFNEENRTTSGTIEFLSTKTPYLYNIWSGEQVPVTVYEQTETRTIIPFTLHGNQSTIVAFLPQPLGPIPASHVTSASAGILAVSPVGTSLAVKAGNAGGALQVKTADGKTHSVANAAAAPFEIKPWKLTVEHWDAPADLTDMTVTAVKSNTTHELPDLVAWNTIPGLEATSGRGHYTAKVQWPPAGGADGAFLDVGRIFHTLAISVNGRRVPWADPFEGRVDVGAYLVDGENEIQITIGTTLINVLRPMWSQMRWSSTTPTKNVPPAQAYGLQEPVVLTPYKITII